MGRKDFGELVKRTRLEQGMSLGRLGFRIGELADGTYLDATGVRNLEAGKRAIEKDPELFDRVVDVLDLDPDEAYVALGLLPPGINLNDIRIRRRGSGRDRREDRQVPTDRAPAGAAVRDRPVRTGVCPGPSQASNLARKVAA